MTKSFDIPRWADLVARRLAQIEKAGRDYRPALDAAVTDFVRELDDEDVLALAVYDGPTISERAHRSLRSGRPTGLGRTSFGARADDAAITLLAAAEREVERRGT